MRLISLVPSITESLIAADAHLVGRSRYCIHPSKKVKSIKKVGGTKDIDWSKVEPLKPELVIFDKEENTLEMANSCPFESIALHIQTVNDVAPELTRLANIIDNQQLAAIAQQWKEVLAKLSKARTSITPSMETLPGMIEWWIPPTSQSRIEYLIWRDPWMTIGENTFIESMLALVFPGKKLPRSEKYPVIRLDSLDPETTCLLFSTEPYPFARYRQELMKLGFSCGLIDGEKYSWYGVRSLAFLQSLLETSS